MSGQNEQFDHFDYFVHFGYIYAMAIVSATHAKQNFAALLDQAQREPVRIQRHERDVAVLVSAEEYEKIHQLRVKELLRFTDSGWHVDSLGSHGHIWVPLLCRWTGQS